MRTLAYLTIIAFTLAVRMTAAQTAQDTAFTYQGELLQNGEPVTASVDMVFTLYDAPTTGNVIGAPVTLSAGNGDPVQVVDGLFTVSLDFGASAFTTTVNDARWLAVSVDGNALTPRTKIENSPYALTAQLAYGVLAGSIGTVQINAAQVQQRVSGSCASGSSISLINPDGSVSCQPAGSGTITGVTPAGGSGITGGGSSGNVSLGADTSILQSRVSGTCSAGSAISVVARDGTVTCQSAGITLPYTATQSTAGPLVNITNTDTSSASTALQGTSNSTAANVSAVEGVISSTSPGLFSSGVRGINNSVTGNGIGVYGTTAGSGAGVNGTSASGPGVFGTSASSYSGYFTSSSSSNTADTLHVDTTNSSAIGIRSEAVFSGLLAQASATNPTSLGMIGQGHTGVEGLAPAAATGGFGVVGQSLDTTTANAFTSSAAGPAGVLGYASAPSGTGVIGQSNPASLVPGVVGVGVFGEADGVDGIGVLGAGNGPGIGVAAFGAVGLQAQGTQRAADFSGSVDINAFQPNSDIELTISSVNANSPNADILLQPYNSLFGFDLSAGGTSTSNMSFCICQTPDGGTFTQFLGLDASGNLAIHGGTATKPGGGSWSAPSDARLKRDIQPLDHMLDKLLQLRGVSFEYMNPDDGIHPLGRHTGFIAQEVQPVFPEWVGQTADGYLSVGPQGFEAMTVEALRDLRAEKDAEIDGLRAQLDELSARLDRLEHDRGAE